MVDRILFSADELNQRKKRESTEKERRKKPFTISILFPISGLVVQKGLEKKKAWMLWLFGHPKYREECHEISIL